MMPSAISAPVEGATLLERIDDLAAGDLAQLLLASVTDYAIYTLDPSGKVTSWNPAAP